VWGGNAAAASSGAAVNISAAQYTLQAGTTYYVTFELSGGSSSSTMDGYLDTTANTAHILNTNGTRMFTTANGASSGACPATTGTLTGTASADGVVILLEP